jgi:hypothetical protein
MARWGLLANRHETSLKNFNFDPRVCFLRLLLRGLYGPSYVKQILKRGSKFNDSIETRYDNFSHLYSKAANTLCELLMKRAEDGEGVAPSNFSLRLPIGKTFSHEATATRGRSNAALYRWF